MEVLQINYRDSEAAQKLNQSLKETGFAVITNHPIPPQVFQRVYDEWSRFFSSDDKMNYLFDRERQSGYFPFKSENAKNYNIKDLKEFFHLYPETALPDGMSDVTVQLSKQLSQLGVYLLELLDQMMPDSIADKLSIPLSQMAQNSQETVFRVLHYPPLTHLEEIGAVRAAPHEDINLITLLPAATGSGLQVKDLARDQWLDVPCDPGAIVLNAGDMLQLTTGGYYKSTSHQVINPTGPESRKSRYSMPLFVHPRSDIKLNDRYTAGDFLNERLRALGLKS